MEYVGEKIEKPKQVLTAKDLKIVGQIPAPVAEEIPTPVAEEIPAPVAEEIPAPVSEEIPAPVAEEIPMPVAEEIHASVAEEIPTPVAEEPNVESEEDVCQHKLYEQRKARLLSQKEEMKRKIIELNLELAKENTTCEQREPIYIELVKVQESLLFINGYYARLMSGEMK